MIFSQNLGLILYLILKLSITLIFEFDILLYFFRKSNMEGMAMDCKSDPEVNQKEKS